MVCIYCGSETQVYNSRHQKRTNNIWRRRRCVDCKAEFTTHELADLSGTHIVLSENGKQEPFKCLKLFLSVYEALLHATSDIEASEELTATVIGQLLEKHSIQISSQEIALATASVLKRFNKEAYLHYCLKHEATKKLVIS